MEMNTSWLVFQLHYKLLFPLWRMGTWLDLAYLVFSNDSRALSSAIICVTFSFLCLFFEEILTFHSLLFRGDRVKLVKAGKHQVLLYLLFLDLKFMYFLAVQSIFIRLLAFELCSHPHIG